MLPFIPVQGPEKAIQNSKIEQGTLYFTTDTGKILMDIDEKRITLGANGASVFYSSAMNLSVNTDDTYTISKSDLEDSFAIPKANDLIINSDGRFFKVNYVDGDTDFQINCRLIAISGTGGGSIGPGGGTDSSDPKVIDVFYKDYKSSFLAGTKYDINLTATSKVDTDLTLSYVVVNSNNRTVDLGSKAIKSGQPAIIEDIGRNISEDGSYHAIIISITGANSRKYELTLTKVRCINLKLEDDPQNFDNAKIYPSSVGYSLKVFGKTTKTLYIEIDGQKRIDPKILSENDDNKSIRIEINCSDLKLSPGVHTITSYLEADGVPSNIIKTDFIYHPVGASDKTYIIVTKYPESCLSYETPEIKYWVYDTSKPEKHVNNISLFVNGVTVEEGVKIAQDEGVINTWTAIGLAPRQNNICEISCNGETRSISIYCEYSDIFDEVSSGAKVLLSAAGRTNQTSLERRQSWSYKNYLNETINAQLSNFNWNNNGWLKDSNKDNARDCLRISNGASVKIPLKLFPSTKPTTGGFTFDIEFKPYNLYSYNLLTQSTETIDKGNENDDIVEINRNFNSDYAIMSYAIKSSDDSAIGFCCGTQDAFFRMSNGDHATVRYMDNEIINLTVTINAAKKQICLYVNGIMSGMTAYKTAAELPEAAENLLINSQYCDIDLYSIRIYDKPLTSSEVVQNYIASKKDLQIYKENKFSSGDTVRLNDLIDYNTENPDNPTMPYIIFKTNKSPDVLPFNKANDDVICDIKFVNPPLDHALDLGIITEDYYKKHAPSFLASGVPLNVQGTSSQKYPRKNFKGKFKDPAKNGNWNCINENVKDKALSTFTIKEGMSEKTFTWKADYMESSSSHNTGFASFVYELYKNHPLDYYENTNVAFGGTEVGTYHKQYRTSLYGFPVLAFHEDSQGNTSFIGLYNFNLDKGADDTLGMAVNQQHPILTDKKYKEVCECWEMANNKGDRCSFRGEPFDEGYDYSKQKFVATTPDGIEYEGTTNIGEDLEVRYHINGDAIEGAWENRNLPADKKGSEYIGSKAAFEVLLGGTDSSNRTGAYKHLERFFDWIQSCFYAFNLSTDEDKTWAESLVKQKALEAKNNGFLNSLKEKVDEQKSLFDSLSNYTEGTQEYIKVLNKANDLASYLIIAGTLIENEQYHIEKKEIKKSDGKKVKFSKIILDINQNDLKEILTGIIESIDENYTIKKDSKNNYYYSNGEPYDIFFKEVRDERREKFEDEFHNHLNLEYCMIYYIITELFIQFDSRGKNMMFSSWGPITQYQTHNDENKTFILDENGEKIPSEYVWFPIYYDIDTQLGVNNSGVPSWEYNVEPSTGFNNAGGARAFSTANSLLWMNFHASYVENKPDMIRKYYQDLRGRNLSINMINKYYNLTSADHEDYCRRGILPINIFNANQVYKYIDPSTEGYVSKIDENGQPEMRITDAYFYCLQGNRELYRKLFLRNRFNYYDSKWMAGSYRSGETGGEDQFWRINAHKESPDVTLHSNLLFNIKPSLDQYLVIWVDDDEPIPVFAKGGEITPVDLSPLMTNTDTYNQQIVHIGGPNYIQEYGNVSLLYLDEFVFQSPSVVKIEMGNENENYVPDPIFKVDGFTQSTANKPLLKVFDITNIGGPNLQKKITSIDLTDSVKLEEFRALGTDLMEVDFANGASLKKVYLPNTLTKISLNNIPTLNKIVYNKSEIYETVGEQLKQNKEVLYIDNLIDANGETKIGSINIIGNSLKQYSYDLLNKLVTSYKNMANSGKTSKLEINMENVQWSPYTKLGDGALYDVEKSSQYKYATDNAKFIDYEYSEDTWERDLLSDRIYFYEELPINCASNLNILDDFINDKQSHFINITNTSNKSYPVITGSMFIDNDSEHPIDEADLFNTYADYFPSLDIKANHILDSYRARFVSIINNAEKNVLTQRVSKSETEAKQIILPSVTTIPTPNHYVFLGWSLEMPSGNPEEDIEKVLSEEELNQYKLGSRSEENYTYPELIFYAIYTKETYTARFVDTKTVDKETSKYDQELSFVYGEQLTEPTLVPYREFEESQLPLTERIAFKGWTVTESNSGIVTSAEVPNIIVDISKITVDRNYTFYPVYVKESVYDSATDEKYFVFVKQDNEYAISASSKYSLQGKITIPASYKGFPVTTVSNMRALKLVKHVFFYGNSNITTIAAEAFKKDSLETSYLIGVYLPESVTAIGISAFNNQTALQHICDEYVKDSNNLGAFGKNISILGSNAFSYCSSLKVYNLSNQLTKIPADLFYQAGTGIRLTSLPPTIVEVGARAFFNCPFVDIRSFGSNPSEVSGSQLKYIGDQAFMTGSDEPSKIVYIYNSVTTISDGAFISYAKDNNTTIYTTHTEKPLAWVDKVSMGVSDIQYGYGG